MTHVALVLYAGVVFLASGASLLEIARLLGKTFKTRVSAPLWVQAVVFVGAVILFGYGCVILFPGQAIQVRHMSVGLPLVGTVVLGMALWLLDHVTAERDPPPWSVDVLRMAALIGRDSVIKGALFRTEPAAYMDPLPREGTLGGRLARLGVMVGAIALVGVIAATILINSSAG